MTGESFPIETPSPETCFPSLLSLVSERLDAAQRRAEPFFVHTLGIPAAGKSSFSRHLHKSFPKDPPAFVAFDAIMEAMPEYKAEPDSVHAFKLYELPARGAGYLLLKGLIDKKADILLDHSGARPDHAVLLRYAKTLGYKIFVVRLLADKETSKARIRKRQLQEGRHTPLDYIDDRERGINALVGDYKKIADTYMEISNDRELQTPSDAFEKACSSILAEVVSR